MGSPLRGITQREGGKLALEDMAAYRPLGTEPLKASYGDFQVVALGPPNTGGLITLGALNIAEVGVEKIRPLRKFSGSPLLSDPS